MIITNDIRNQIDELKYCLVEKGLNEFVRTTPCSEKERGRECVCDWGKSRKERKRRRE